MDIPASMHLQSLWSEGRNLQFLSGVQGLKSFKIVNYGEEKRKLIGFFEIWDSLHKALNHKPVWEGQRLSWCTHHSSNHTKKAPKPPVAKLTKVTPGLSYASMVKQTTTRTTHKVKPQSQKVTQDLQKMEKVKALLLEVFRSI